MANLPSISQKLTDSEIFQNGPIIQNVFEIIGSSINALIDNIGSQQSLVFALDTRLNNAKALSVVASFDIFRPKIFGTTAPFPGNPTLPTTWGFGGINWNNSESGWRVTELKATGLVPQLVQTTVLFNSGIGNTGNEIPYKWLNAIPAGTSDNYFAQFRLNRFGGI